MAKRFQGFIFGMVFTFIIGLTIPISANSSMIDAVINSVNIVVNNNKIASVGQPLILSDGNQVPFSIVHKGTTYLAVRKISECLNNDVVWNESTKTVTITSKSSSTQTLSNVKMYSKYPNVPDFGALVNINPMLTIEGSYVYNQDLFPIEKIGEYTEILKSVGFSYDGSFNNRENIPVLIFKNSNCTVMVSTTTLGGSLVFTVMIT